MTRDSQAFVFSIALEGFERKFAGCIKTQIRYCRKYDYRYLLVKDAPYKLYPNEAAWLKVPLLLAALAAGYDWVAFLDADCEVRSHTPEFMQYLSGLAQNQSIFMARGFSERINSGVIFVKNQPEAIDFLNTILKHADQEILDPADAAPYENGHFIHWGKKNQSIHLLEHGLWNNNSRVDAGSYIQHYSRGKIRDNYLKSRSSTITRWVDLLNDRLRVILRTDRSGNWQRTSEGNPIISQSMRNLLSFYTTKYPDFFADIYNLDVEAKS